MKKVARVFKHVADAKARENVRVLVVVGFRFTSDWMKKVARVFKPIV